MTDNATINVFAGQNDAAKDEIITQAFSGKWIHKNEKEHILYTDTLLIEGYETKTHITLDKTTLSIVRRGAIENELSFEVGVKKAIPYVTPFGVIDMISSTKDLSIELTENQLDVKITYFLTIHEETIGPHFFHLFVTRNIL